MKFGAYGVLITFLVLPVVSEAGSLYMEPLQGAYSIGETFEVQLFADSGGEEINAVEAELTFNPTVLSVDKVSTEGSILSSWSTEPSYANGVLRFAGWTSEHYSGERGLLLTIHFRALRNASGNAHLAAGAILATNGSNIITSMKSGVYLVGPREVVEEDEAEFLSDEQDATQAESSSSAMARGDLEAPEFLTVEKSFAAGERIEATGRARDADTVVVSLTHNGEEETYHVQPDADGGFRFITSGGVEEGVYRLFAYSVSESGDRSPSSERITISVRGSGMSALAASGSDYAYLFMPLVIFLLVAGLTFGYIFHKRGLEARQASFLTERGKQG